MSGKQGFLVIAIFFSLVLTGMVNQQGQSSLVRSRQGYQDAKALAAQSPPLKWNTGLADANASFVGQGMSNQSGNSVAIAGDVNGDGFADFLVGEPQGCNGAISPGKVYLFFGNGSLKLNANLNTTANATFIGQNHFDFAGATVAGAGDVNNDGHADFLIGAPGHGGTGCVYLIYGGPAIHGTYHLGTDANATFLGQTYAGSSVAAAGDVNHDGCADFLVGDYAYSNFRGKVYLVFGNSGASQWSGVHYLVNEAGASFEGEHKNDYAGLSVSSAGDMNHDGFGDFLIGAPYYPSNAKNGKTYLILGNGSLHLNTNLTYANASFIGVAKSNWAGQSVAGSFDLNQDGWNDILIGRSSKNAYIIYGNGSLHLNMNLTAANVTFIDGSGEGGATGYAVASAGDVNGDGHPDILIGAFAYSSSAGKVYLFYGNGSTWPATLPLSQANASFIGENANDRAGYSLAGGGDINHDGSSDILIGAPYYNNGPITLAGKTYVIYGIDTQAPGATTNLAVLAISTTSVILTWTAPGDDGNRGTVTGYAVKYSTTPITDETSFSAATTFTQTWGALKAGGQTESRNITGLSTGMLYYFAIKAFDELLQFSVISNIATGTTTTNVAPAITQPSNITYTLGATGNSISWTITDTTTSTTGYTIYRDSTLNTTGSWTSGTPVTQNVDGLSIGIYNYTIKATDGLGGSVKDTVIVTVTNAAPAITHPSDITYNSGATGNSISWTITDSSTGTTGYTIYRNGTSATTSSWTSGTPVTISIDGLAAGKYNYTIVAVDGLGSSTQDTVIVTVVSPQQSVPFDSSIFAIIMFLGLAGLVALSLKKKTASA